MNAITIETIVNAPMDVVWERWNKPEHIERWAFASDDWEALNAENDLRVGGTLKTTMAARDKSASFDFTGVYTAIKEHELIEYDMDAPPSHEASEGQSGRHVKIAFIETPDGVKIVQTFDAETENSEEMQRSGWQAILDNFKKYAESI